eukprot:7908589-Lingulodinium_polyedra.AAC.1
MTGLMQVVRRPHGPPTQCPQYVDASLLKAPPQWHRHALLAPRFLALAVKGATALPHVTGWLASLTTQALDSEPEDAPVMVPPVRVWRCLVGPVGNSGGSGGVHAGSAGGGPGRHVASCWAAAGIRPRALIVPVALALARLVLVFQSTALDIPSMA